jgi:hypothetical protein
MSYVDIVGISIKCAGVLVNVGRGRVAGLLRPRPECVMFSGKRKKGGNDNKK